MKMKIFASVVVFVVIAVLACRGGSPPTAAVPPLGLATAAPTEPPPGEIAAVDLIGAWVNAGASETDPFEFVGRDGRTYVATFADDVAPLFDRPNRWFDGAKECANCHTSDLNDSDAELDLSSYEGIVSGSYRLSNPSGTPIILPGNWEASLLRRRLTLNRMPPGITDDVDRDGPEIEVAGGKTQAAKLIGAWVDAGASGAVSFQFMGTDGVAYTTTYAESIQPLFSRKDVWYPGAKACERCHNPVLPLADAELDVTSAAGVLAGAFRLTQPPGVPIVIPGDWENSPLRHVLRDNRMPNGLPYDIPPEGPVVEAGQLK